MIRLEFYHEKNGDFFENTTHYTKNDYMVTAFAVF